MSQIAHPIAMMPTVPPSSRRAARAPRAQAQDGVIGSAMVAAVLGGLVLIAAVRPEFRGGLPLWILEVLGLVAVVHAIVVVARAVSARAAVAVVLAALGALGGGVVGAGLAVSAVGMGSQAIANTASAQASLGVIAAQAPSGARAAELSRSVAGIALLLQHDHSGAGQYPARLTVRGNGEVDEPSGLPLGGIPTDSILTYHVLPSGGFTLEVADRHRPSTAASFDSATGRVTVGGTKPVSE